MAQLGSIAPKDKSRRMEIDIFGDTYKLRTDNDPEYIKKLAKMVDDHMQGIARKTRTFTGSRIGVLAALELADEYCQLKKDYDELLELLDEK
ncbi:MAG: cell division protein ZapA [Selenomonadaceae bacterium]|nr:cell division protein ZapA [Selenomonadaceae bacterium]